MDDFPMSLLLRIFGWSPPENEEFINVDIASNPMPGALQNRTFRVSNPNVNPIGGSLRELSRNFESTSPTSSTSALSTDGEAVDNDAEESGKHAGAAWVARPRNEFILFRCDYVRKHTREGKRVRRAPCAEAKTLSKKAAEAWHELPPEERLYWKERANGERNEHAHRYPDYRYRPRKSAQSRKRQTRSFPAKAAVLALPEEVSETAIQSAWRPSESTSHRSPSSGGISTTTSRRRSSSVPDLNVADPTHRRARSNTAHGWLSADTLPFGPPSRDFTLAGVPSRPQNTFGSAGLMSQEYSTSQSSQSSSDMPQSSWNTSSTAQSTQFVAPTSVSLDTLTELNVNNQLPRVYTTGGTPNPISATSSQQFPYPAEDESPWSQLQPYETDATRTAGTYPSSSVLNFRI